MPCTAPRLGAHSARSPLKSCSLVLDGCHWLEFEPDASLEMAHAAAVTLSKLGNLIARVTFCEWAK